MTSKVGESEPIGEAVLDVFSVEVNPMHSRRLEGLRPDTYYLLKLSAQNGIGQGPAGTIEIKTSSECRDFILLIRPVSPQMTLTELFCFRVRLGERC